MKLSASLTIDDIKAEIADLKVRLTNRYPSADEYYADRDRLRRFEAALVGKSPREYDPVGYWHGMQSN